MGEGMKKGFLVFLCIIWMGVIFYNSSNIGSVSHKQSMDVVNFITGKMAKITEAQGAADAKVVQSPPKQSSKEINNEKNTLDHIVRKNAHAFEYLVLAVVVSAILFSLKLKGRSAVIYILFVCLFYAVLDEFHQEFVSLRTSSVTDVLIDFGGSIIGMGLFYIIYYRKKVLH